MSVGRLLELAARAENLAAGLLALGLCPGDRIGIWSPNNAEWVLAQFASALAGLILVTVNPAYQSVELRHALRKSGCKALVLRSGFKSTNYFPVFTRARAGTHGCRHRWSLLPAITELRYVINLGPECQPGMLRFSDVAATAVAEDRSHLKQLSNELRLP